MLRIQSLTKTFSSRGSVKTALDAVSLSMNGGALGNASEDESSRSYSRGGLLCLLGSNGSGKTTLLKILAGLVLPDSGTIEIAGVSIADSPSWAQSLVGFSPGEERSFYGRLSGMENLRFFSRLRGMDEFAFQKRIRYLESPLGLKEILPLTYQKTSSGMKQKLSLARALLHEPRLLLLDEPTKNLDPLSADRLHSFIKSEFVSKPDHLVIWTTHNLEEAWEIGTEIAVLQHGKLLAKDSPADLLRKSGASSYKAAYEALLEKTAQS